MIGTGELAKKILYKRLISSALVSLNSFLYTQFFGMVAFFQHLKDIKFKISIYFNIHYM